MRVIRSRGYLLAVVALLAIVFSGQAYADEEALARQAEQEGKLRQALTHYVAALQSTSEGSSKDQQLREKIIKLAHKIQPPPAVPEKAERRMARGRAAVKAAKNEEGFLRAAKEFQKAVRAAPWLAEGYYNLGVVQDKAGRYDGAIRNLKLYMLATPDAPDIKQVRNLIYEIEYRQEEAGRAKVEEREKAARARQEKIEKTEEMVRNLVGRWVNRTVNNNSIYYQLTVTGRDSFKLKYLHTVSAEGTLRPWLRKIETTVKKGRELSGTETLIDETTIIGCRLPQITILMTGSISDDGNRIVIVYNLPWPDRYSCKWDKSRAKEVVVTLYHD